MTTKERYKNIINYFSKNMPEASPELVFGNTYELIVAVILSAQCTDKRVNIITQSFFKKYPDIDSLAIANLEDVYGSIKSCSYPNNKSKHLIGMAKSLKYDYNSIVPSDIKELQKIPGIGRKSANVIASVIYNKPVMAVDTHVFRVSARLGLTLNAKTPLETEKQLTKNIPQQTIPIAHHWLILHGRYICTARKPKCDICKINEFCKYYSESILKTTTTNKLS